MIDEPPSAPPPPQIDGQRVFRGKPLLTDYELTILNQISRSFLGIVYQSGQPEFYCSTCKKLRRDKIGRLIHFGYLYPSNDGLPFGQTQTYRVAPTSSWPRDPRHNKDPPF